MKFRQERSSSNVWKRLVELVSEELIVAQLPIFGVVLILLGNPLTVVTGTLLIDFFIFILLKYIRKSS